MKSNIYRDCSDRKPFQQRGGICHQFDGFYHREGDLIWSFIFRLTDYLEVKWYSTKFIKVIRDLFQDQFVKSNDPFFQVFVIFPLQYLPGYRFAMSWQKKLTCCFK